MNLRKDNSGGRIVTADNVTRVEPSNVSMALPRYNRAFKVHDISGCNDVTEIAEKLEIGVYTQSPSRDCGGFDVIRDDKGEPVTMVRSSFTMSQPIQSLAEMDVLREPLGFNYSQGGMLNNGTKLFVKGELGEFDVNGDGSDVIKKHIIALDGLDGSTARTILLGFVRMVCANGQLLYDVGSVIYKVKHTKNAQKRVNAKLSELTEVTQRFQFLEDDIATLSQIDFSETQVSRVAEIVFPKDSKNEENKRERILEQFSNSRLGTFGNSAWDCFNAFTAWNNHDKTSRETEITSASENRFLNVEVNSRGFGSNVRAGIDIVLAEDKKAEEKLKAELLAQAN